MKCPSCGDTLSPLTAGEIKLDACAGGCGGIWFDREELSHFDEPHEFSTHPVLELARRCEGVKPEPGCLKVCPHCPGERLVRQFIDVAHEVEIDQCWNCAGVWFDLGEINRFRNQFATTADRARAVNASIDRAMETARAEMSAELKERLARYDENRSTRFRAALTALAELLGVDDNRDDL